VAPATRRNADATDRRYRVPYGPLLPRSERNEEKKRAVFAGLAFAVPPVLPV